MRKIAVIALTLALLGVLALNTHSVHAFSRAPKGMTIPEAGVALNEFTWDMFDQLAKEPGNLFFSPASMELALAMTWTGARGQTAQDMGDVLHISGDPVSVSQSFGELQNALVGKDAPYTLRIANRLWGQQGLGFKNSFLDPLAADFGAGLQEMDFYGNPEESRVIINQWVADQTEDKIEELFAQGTISRSVRLALTNAVYFLGEWSSRFDGHDTRDLTFFLSDGKEIRVPTMHQTHQFSYAENEDLQLVSLPYEGGDVEMVIILPRDPKDLATIEAAMGREQLTGLLEARQDKTVRLYLPKFNITGEFSLADVLTSMGMGIAFNNNADFSGMTDQEKLAISRVIHKSFIDVYEKGTEAAAATGVTMRLTSMPMTDPDTVEFRADHPFLFLIRHVETDAVLFLGRLADPRGQK